MEYGENRITKYFLVHKSKPRIVFGASYGRIAGFSFNVLNGVPSTGDDHIDYMNDLITNEGYKIVDSVGNELDGEDMIKYIDHTSKGKAFSTKFRDRWGYSFTEVKDTKDKR